MARAAAKRRQPAPREQSRRRHKDSGGQRFEDTLFFNRLRKQAKWVFVFLVVVFAGGFVLFGVGSSNLSGLSDIFNGIRGSGSGPSVSKELKRTEQQPKNAQAWHDLASAYEARGNVVGAIGAWQTYTSLRPKDPDGWSQLANDYSTRLSAQAAAFQAAQAEAQAAQPGTYGPPSTTPLGRALASVPDPIATAASTTANQRASDAYNAAVTTANQLVAAYQHVAGLEPTNPSNQLLLADAATQARNLPVAIAAYKKFIELAPYDNQVSYAKQQIKTLQAQLGGGSQG